MHPTVQYKHNGELITSTFESTWYWLNEELLSPDKVHRVLEICQNKKEVEALTSGAKTPSHEIRKNKISWHNDNELYSMIRPLGNNINEAAGWKYHITAIEPIQFTTYYGDENHYTWHTDTIINDQERNINSNGPLAGTTRKMTISIQLTDPAEYDGGEFEFLSSAPSEDGKTLGTKSVELATRKRGAGIAFPSFCYHRVKPVTRGVRRSLVCWFRGPKWV
jgi:PKHD-type hydroxylase